MLHWQWKAFSSIGSIGLALWLFGLGWVHLGPRKPEVGPMRRQVAEQVVPQAVEDIRLGRQEVRGAALLHLSNDPSDFVTDLLRDSIEKAGVLDLPDRSFLEKARNLLRLRQPFYDDLDSAVARGKSLGAAAVLFGRVERFESGPKGAQFDLDLTLASVDDGKVVFTKRYSRDIAPGLFSNPVVQEQMQAIKPARRFLGWVVIVLLLPVFSIAFIRAMVRKESNRVNAFTLTVYTVVDALLAYLLLGAALTGWLSVLLFIVAVGAALAYNFRVMNFALRLET